MATHVLDDTAERHGVPAVMADRGWARGAGAVVEVIR
jgi:hypothetical protein